MRVLIFLFVYLSSTLFAFSQINYSIKDAVGLLISNPQFIESVMQYDGYEYTGAEMNKFHTFAKPDNPMHKLVCTFNNDRVNVINWSENLSQQNYNSFLTELTSLGFSKLGNTLSLEYFNTSMISFENLKMNCYISIITKYKEGILNLTIGRKIGNKPVICPNYITTFQGEKSFSDGLEGWNLNVKITGEQIIIKYTPHPNNNYASKDNNSPLTIKGYLKNGIIYSTIPEKEAKEIHPSVYKYFKNNLYESNIENGYNKYVVINKVKPLKIPLTYKSPTVDSGKKAAENTQTDKNFAYNTPEVDSTPKIGLKKIKDDLSEIIKLHYNPLIKNNLTEFRISFIVEKDGKLSKFHFDKNLPEDISTAFINYLNNTEFLPAIANGRAVKQLFSINIPASEFTSNK